MKYIVQTFLLFQIMKSLKNWSDSKLSRGWGEWGSGGIIYTSMSSQQRSNVFPPKVTNVLTFDGVKFIYLNFCHNHFPIKFLVCILSYIFLYTMYWLWNFCRYRFWCRFWYQFFIILVCQYRFYYFCNF